MSISPSVVVEETLKIFRTTLGQTPARNVLQKIPLAPDVDLLCNR